MNYNAKKMGSPIFFLKNSGLDLGYPGRTILGSGLGS
jgi:hypothetical protein